MSRDFRYDRQSIRLSGYDYSTNGYYFVTICTHNRECLLGKIFDKKMELNDFGKMADHGWKIIPERFSNVRLDTYQIMPNHMHLIVVINNSVGAGLSRPKININVDNGRDDRAPTKTNFKTLNFVYTSIITGMMRGWRSVVLKIIFSKDFSILRRRACQSVT